MSPRYALLIALWLGLLPGGGTAIAHAAPAPEPAFLQQYCVTCHSRRAHTGGLVLEGLDPAHAAGDPALWERVARKLRAGLMPPASAPRPAETARAAFADGLEAALDAAAAAHPNPGRVPALHRLNRAEYRNAVRDLLAVDLDLSALLPPDDASHGFDTMAGAKMDATRMERYLLVASRVSAAAVGAIPAEPQPATYEVPEDQSQADRQEGLPFGTRGGVRARHLFPADGEYVFTVSLLCKQSVACDPLLGVPDAHTLEIALDGEPMTRVAITPVAGRAGDDEPAHGRYQVRAAVRAGTHVVTAAFLRQSSWYEVETLRRRFDRPYFKTPAGVEIDGQTIYQPYLRALEIVGPYGPAGSGETPSRRRIFTCRPTQRREEEACAAGILGRLARQAYRRPVREADLALLMRFYREGRTDGGFEEGIGLAIERLLVSPSFLYRVERDAPASAPGSVTRISDLELASRLSFFLWSSLPDAPLLAAATRGELRQPAVLDRQVRRMLADRKARALVDNFAGQWLQLRNMEAVHPAEPLFPNFDDTLRQAFRTETELFVESVIREDRSVVDLLTADYTFLNERLAAHYGIPFVKGSHFRRVTLPADSPRRGLLGQGSILSLTSRPNRTSPVLRGKWVLESLLGSPPPPPPPNVPPLREKAVGSVTAVASVRQRMAAHRANPVCAGCHQTIDPIGFALESFDAVGRWRDVDEEFAPIDAAGTLPDGTAVTGLADLRAALVRQPDRFATTVIERLLTYAIGRGLEPFDQPAVRAIRRAARADGYRVSTIVRGIAASLPFQARAAGAPGPAAAMTAARSAQP